MAAHCGIRGLFIIACPGELDTKELFRLEPGDILVAQYTNLPGPLFFPSLVD